MIDSAIVMESMQKKIARYDRAGEEHYDNISAMIKSMRGSDPDAAIFYFARALRAGEDIQFIARRIAICAAEDVGMANPQILSIALDAWQAASMIGLPEARIPLAQAVIAVATSPKSNASICHRKRYGRNLAILAMCLSSQKCAGQGWGGSSVTP